MPSSPATFNDGAKLSHALAEVLTSWPLYREYRYYDQTKTQVLPAVIEMFCANSSCQKETRWETSIYSNIDHLGTFQTVEYKCRNCKESSVRYNYHWYRLNDAAAQVFVKFGQWPALEKRIPPELKRHLAGADYELYQKALRCRSQNLGIGALGYMRRVVENRTNELLDMLAAEARQSGASELDLKDIEQAKKTYRFSEKIDLAKKIIPATLRPGGHNPVDQLHDIASEGLHSKNEEECSIMFDQARDVFEFLFQEMERRKAAAAAFHSGLSAIATRNS